ncbi:MAG TPA: hypothetical protein DEQ26_04540 [Flavobacteriaceae bacterium]|nr:hypothetical protein [Flavobacteriaceae bacterium]
MKSGTKYYLSIEERISISKYLKEFKKETIDIKNKKRIEVILGIFDNQKYGLTLSQRRFVSRILSFYHLISAIDDKELIGLITKFE